MSRFVGLPLAALLACAGWAQVTEGGFEKEGLPGWRVIGQGITAQRVTPPGWARHAGKFNSGEYTELRIYLRVQRGIGSVAFDEVRVGDLALANPGFEEAEGDRLKGWGQDNAGRTIFGSTDDPAAGARCLLIRQAKSETSRVWQDVPCAANTDYEASVWMRPIGFQGDADAEIYGLRHGQLGKLLWQSDHVTGQAYPQLGTGVLELRGTSEGAAGVEQETRVPPGRNLFLSADLAAPRVPQGRLAVSAWSQGKLLAELALDAEQQRWRTRRTLLQSPAEGSVVVRVTATGRDVLAYIDNVVLAEPAAGATVAEAEAAAGERNFVLGPSLFVWLEPGASELLRNGAAIVAEKLAGATAGAVSVAVGEGEPAVQVTVERPPTPPAWPRSESFVTASSESGIHITAPTDQGAVYGMMALPQLVSQRADGQWQLVAARLEDAPAMPFRGTYMAGLPREQAARIAWCRRLAALRLNAVVIEDDIWWNLDREPERQVAQEAFTDFRAYGLEPIPELQSFGWAGAVLRVTPMAAEGTWVQGEAVKLTGEEPAALAHPNVLRTEATDIVVESAQGTVYQAGRDYEVIPGETRFVYSPGAKAWAVRRLTGGRIPDGATVSVSYDYVSRVNSENCPYCPSEPLVAAVTTEAMRNTVRYLKPRYVHLGHDEPAQMNTDSRCLRRHMTNAELLAEDVKRLNDAAHAVDPTVRLMMWADAVNPYHNGYQFPDDPTANAIRLLPKDVIQCLWFYGPDQPPKQGTDSLRYFGVNGFSTTGSPWFDEACGTRWAQACLASRQRGEDCLGVLYTSWGGRWEGLAKCAESAWRPPPLPEEAGQ